MASKNKKSLFKKFTKSGEKLHLVSTNLGHVDMSQCDVGYLETRQTHLEKLWNEIEDSYNTIFDSNMTTTEPESDQLSAEYSTYAELYYKTSATIRNALSTFRRPSVGPNPAAASTFSQESTVNRSKFVKLPPIHIEPFVGNYANWPEFRDNFTAAVIKNETLDDAQRLYHLRDFTRGQALEIVKRFKLSNQDFQRAWDKLKTTYENKRIFVNTQLKVLFSLPLIGKESSAAVKKLADTINDCLAALQDYSVNTDHWDPIVVYLASQRLPTETLTLYEQSLTNPEAIPNWKDFHAFLQNRFRTLEVIADTKGDIDKTNKNNNNTPTQLTKKDSCKVAFHTRSTYNCQVCKENHGLRSCKKFLSMNPNQRHKVVKSNNCCFNCLASSHRANNCSSTYRCNECGARHHSLLHKAATNAQSSSPGSAQNQSNAHSAASNFQNVSPLPETNSSRDFQNVPNVSTPQPFNARDTVTQASTHPLKTFFTNKSGQILLATALVKVTNNKKDYSLRALIDPASEASFILEDSLKQLNLPTRSTSFQITGMSNTQTGFSTKMTELDILSFLDPNVKIRTTLFVLAELTGNLPSQRVDSKLMIENISEYRLADPCFHQPSKIDMVLGADIYSDIIQEGVKKLGSTGPVIQNTVFGWIVSGRCADPIKDSVQTFRSFFSEIKLDELIRKFWEQEEVITKKYLSEEDSFCETHFHETCYRHSDGRYVVQLPIKPQYKNLLPLGSSREKALAQYLRLETNLAKTQEINNLYNEVLAEYLTLNHMTPTQNLNIGKQLSGVPEFYLPHHAVLKPSSLSTKLRVVFNASSKSLSNISLNEILYPGPALQQDLSMIILRWRLYPFVFTADIQKMYRQIWLNPKHTSFQKVLFRKNKQAPIEDFELTTVTFGVNCAPFLAMRVLLQLAQDEREKFPKAASIVESDFFVDDVLSGGFTLSETKSAQIELKALLSSAGFKLKKWAANHPKLLSFLPPVDCINADFLSLNDNDAIKALGIYWLNTEDFFTFRFDKFENVSILTKRQLFSNIAKLFDPLGWLAPVIIVSKILMQEVWKEKVQWDEPIPIEHMKAWTEFEEDLPALHKLKISRWLRYTPKRSYQLHGFADASTKAMAAALYLRVIDENNNTHVTLLSSKTRVAPLKVISLPRLELCAAVLLSKLVKSVKINLNLQDGDVYLWSDSTIPLAWLRSQPFRWKTFIANRISIVLDNVGSVMWQHVSSEQNPADVATRGLSASALLESSLWWHGPTWLSSAQIEWPSSNKLEETTLELKPCKTLTTTSQSSILVIFAQFSTLAKALRTLAYVFRFVHHSRKQNIRPRDKIITCSEISNVKRLLIIQTQKQHFELEYKKLLENGSLTKESSILNLNPFMDQNGFMRVHGRLVNANLPSLEKMPIILPYNSHFSRLLVDEAHKDSLHGGIQLMAYLIRKQFWIPRLRTLIKSRIFNCMTCFRQKGETLSQLMGALPPVRITRSLLFTNVGVDYAGPVTIKSGMLRNSKMIKAYICLFVCFATKAIHLEPVHDLSTQAFLSAFRRFISRRPLCRNIYSDNGTNFVGACTELKKLLKKAIQEASFETAKILASKGINWHFIPPGSPHMGGLWEAGVKQMKHHLRRVMGSNTFTFEQLTTTLCQIEAILNSRPLFAQSDDPADLAPITPGHVMYGEALRAFPEPDISSISTNVLKEYDIMQKIRDSFWHRWSSEYISQMHKRSRWRTPQRNVQVGDLVMIKEENVPRLVWKLGRIMKVHPGRDNLVRVATMKTENGEIRRPIQKLCYLPFQYDSDDAKAAVKCSPTTSEI